MKRKRFLLTCVLALMAVVLTAGSASAQASPQFQLGFKALADRISSVVGKPLEDEHYAASGDSLQQTSTGLMVWRKADNWTAFTNGYTTWINGPYGIQNRVNTERFSWESPSAGPNAPPSGQIRLHFIDVGQGDSLLLQTSDGKTALIDGGSAGSGALQYLGSQGVQHLDAVILTHSREDHVGGLPEVMRAIPVDRVYAGGQPTSTQAYERFLGAVAASRAEYREVKRGDRIGLGSLTLDVLNPSSNRPDSDLNNGSVVLRFSYGPTTFLLTGDAEKEAEVGMLVQSAVPLQADILKVGYHGSRTASSAPFLSAVQPKVAVYSAGLGNSYGYPHPETLAALAAVGAAVYGTDRQGTVVVTADGSGYAVSTSSPPRVPPVAEVPPTPTPPARPTSASAASPVGQLSLEIVSVSSPVRRGSTATLAATTSPGASSTIAVYYWSGPSTAAGLVPKTADAFGNVSWSWTVEARATPGTWAVVVTATKDGAKVSKQTSFTVE